jgi:hypothetical protein
MLNFNVDPYYDDFDPSNNYHKILFRPGRAVQARELTQSQTILQNQISNFADHFFTQNTPIKGGKLTINTNVEYLKLNYEYAGSEIVASDFKNQYITDDTDTVRARVIATEEGVIDGDPPTLILNYLSSDKFSASANVRNLDTLDVVATIVSANANGKSSIASVSNGIFYIVNGYSMSSKENDDGTYNKYSIGNFVDVLPQTIILNKYNDTPTARIGLDIVEFVTDYVGDSTLLDPALGASNFQAPGADRYTINLNLTTKKSTDIAGSDSNFIELARVESGQIIRQVNNTSYSQIDDYFAKRTFETNGDYVVNNFNLIPTKNTFPTGTSKYVLNVGPGVAYVRGYRTENQSTLKLDANRARTTANINNNIVTPSYGNYFYVNTLLGGGGEVIDTTTLQPIDFHISNTSMITTTNTTTYNSTLAGTARLRFLRYSTSGDNSDTTSYVYRAHVSDLSTTALTGSISSATSTTISISDTSGKFCGRVANIYAGMTLRIDSGPGTGQTRTIQSYDVATKQLTVTTAFTILPTSSSTFSIKFAVKDFESLIRTSGSPSFTVYGSAQIDNRSKVGTVATGDTYVSDPGDGELVFPVGNPYVNSVSDASYVSSQVYRGQQFTTTTTGVYKNITVDFSAQSVLNFIRTGSSESNDSIKQNFIVIVTDRQTNANLTNGQIVPFVGSASPGLNRTVVVNSGKTGVTLSAPDLQPFIASVYCRMNVIGGDNTSYVRKTKTLAQANTYSLGITGSSGTINSYTLMDLTKGQIYINNSLGIIKNGLPQPLYVSDVKKIVKIIDPGSATPTLSMLTDETKDVTNNFIFDNGQRDTYYGQATIKLKPGRPVPTRLWILFDFYEHTGGDGYFDVNSYVNEDYAEIGTFTSSSGNQYRLRDCIDFRPAVKNVQTGSGVFKYSVTPTPTNFYGSLIPEDESSFTCDYYYYLGRKDLLVITKDSVIKLIEGIPDINPVYPTEEANSLVLAKLVYDPYTAYIPGEYPGVIPNLSIIPVSHKTWLMKDITKLNDRIRNLEYYTSLNLLEQSTTSLQIQDEFGLNRFKNGILVDNFTTFSIADTRNADYLAQINTKERTLSPGTISESFHLFNMDFDPVEAKPTSASLLNYKSHKIGTTNVFTLPYVQKELVVQKLASRFININSFDTKNIEGILQISPAIDNWIDVVTPPSSQGTQATLPVEGPIQTNTPEAPAPVTVVVPPPEYMKIGPIDGSTTSFGVFTSNNPPAGASAVYTSQQGDEWSQFRYDYGVWGTSDLGVINKSFNRTYTLTFTKSGYYLFEGAVDDTGTVSLDGNDIFGSMGYYGGTYTQYIYVAAGNHTLYYTATNTVDLGCMALRVSYYGDAPYVAPVEIGSYDCFNNYTIMF